MGDEVHRVPQAAEEPNSDTDEKSTGNIGLRKRILTTAHKTTVVKTTDISRTILQDSSLKNTVQVHTTEVGSSSAAGAPQKYQFGAKSREIFDEMAPNRGQPPLMKRRKRSTFVPMARRSTSGDYARLPSTLAGVRISILKKKAWTTADTLRSEAGAYIIFAMRDFFVYLVFLAVLVTVYFGPLDYAYNYYSTVISDIMTNTRFRTNIDNMDSSESFATLRSANHSWSFINRLLLIILFDPSGKVFLENILVGAPAIRQLRVRNDTCTTAPMFADLYKTCWDYYSLETEDRSSYGLSPSPSWVFAPDENKAPSKGHFGTYGGGGYPMNITSSDLHFGLMELNRLENQTWIRPGIRAAIIDVALYTPNTNLFCIIKLILEFPPVGGVFTSSSFTTAKFFRYLTPWDGFIVSCEFMFIMYTIFFTLEESQQIWILGEEYLANWWNVLDLMIIVLSYCTIGFGINRTLVIYESLKSTSSILNFINTSEHGNFDDLISAQNAFNVSCSILVFFAWLKLFKFSSLNKSVALLLSSIEKVKYELLVVVFMTIIINVGFGLLGICLFGTHVAEFQDLTNSFFSMTSLFTGRLYYYKDCVYASRTWAPIFFSFYTLTVVVIFHSMYVALIVYGYNEAHISMHEGPTQMYLADLIYNVFLEILVFCRQFTLIKKIQQRAVLMQNQRDYDAFEVIFKRHGCHGLELQLLLQSHEIRRGDELSLDQMSDTYNDYCLRIQLFLETEGHNKINEHIDKVEKMVEFCDQAIVDIMTKVDFLVNKTIPDNTVNPTKI